MGVSFHSMRFLEAAANTAPLGDVLTFGRQNLNVTRDALREVFKRDIPLDDYVFAESFIERYLGATSVASLDFSDFEGATYTGDLNVPVNLDRRFDTVVDFGTSEHVFDVASSFRNAIRLCRTGGRIVHAIPSNSACGHGFYQFAPELFFSLYSDRNGFAETEVYLADMMDQRHWWHATRPAAGRRLAANSLSTTYALCRTTKLHDVDSLVVHQSDYAHAWNVGEVREKDGNLLDTVRRRVRGTFAAHLATLGYRSWFAKTGLTRYNPNLTKVGIASQIG